MVDSIFGTIAALVVSAIAFKLAWRWWPTWYNPVAIGVLAWIPALVMINWPPLFVTPLYIHQNLPYEYHIFIALPIAFLSFWAGCVLVKTLSPRGAFERRSERMHLFVDDRLLMAFYLIGLTIFLYAYLSSGLTDLTNLDAQAVAERRIALHLGPISFLQMFMDIAAIGFFARFLQTGRWIYAIPIALALLAYGATFQKSLIMWIVVAAIFVGAIHPKATYRLLLKGAVAKMIVIVAGLSVLGLLSFANEARGMSDSRLTDASSPLAEQVYIYSGATAIKNIALSAQEYLPTDGPTYGAYLARPVLWNFVDRDMFDAGRYYEGVNGATYLNAPWIDFRWFGFFIGPLATAILVMFFLRYALSGRLAGLVFGAVAFRAVVFTTGTDIIFEPVVWYMLILALVVDYVTFDRRGARAAKLALQRQREIARNRRRNRDAERPDSLGTASFASSISGS